MNGKEIRFWSKQFANRNILEETLADLWLHSWNIGFNYEKRAKLHSLHFLSPLPLFRHSWNSENNSTLEKNWIVFSIDSEAFESLFNKKTLYEGSQLYRAFLRFTWGLKSHRHYVTAFDGHKNEHRLFYRPKWILPLKNKKKSTTNQLSMRCPEGFHPSTLWHHSCWCNPLASSYSRKLPQYCLRKHR